MIFGFRVLGMVPLALFIVCTAQAQVSVYYQKLVYDADGELIERTPPVVGLVAYLNGDEGRILTETAPRNTGDTPNISGNGAFGVELLNFPSLAPGDSVTLRVTDSAIGQQGSISSFIHEIPWVDPKPFNHLELTEVDLPPRPSNVRLDADGVLSWDGIDSLTYSVYRRALEDQRPDGVPRHVYTRVAREVSASEFVDPDAGADSTFAYIVFSHAPNGITSLHSEEVSEPVRLVGLEAEPGATNVTLNWTPFDTPTGRTVGYAIYRSEEPGVYGDPVAYTGLEPTFTDSRLEPGTTYYYIVRARNDRLEEVGEADELAVTTLPSTDGLMTYANLKVAVVLYANAIRRGTGEPYRMSEQAISDIKKHLEIAREFYWRNSRMNLNLEFEYIIIDEYKDFGGLATAENRAQSVTFTGKHLAEDFGVMSTQYDLIYRITPSTGGNYSWGVTDMLDLPGPVRAEGGRQVAFSQHPVPQQGDFDEYPGEFDTEEEGYNHIWLFIHEAQHAIDAIYRFNDRPEMGHGDYPWLYGNPQVEFGQDPGYPTGPYPPDYPQAYGYRFGRRFDFQATMLREFKGYHDLRPTWGDIYETADLDGDGFPDDDPRVPLDEARFGSLASSPDTDGDGLSDLDEAMAGIYHYSTTDPKNPDTDDDGLLDGDDTYPLYPITERIKRVRARWKPTIDGDVSEWSEEALVSEDVFVVTDGETFHPRLFMAYDQDSLYLAIALEKLGVPEIRFDFDADGHWYGAGNTTIGFNLSAGDYDVFESWDARADVQQFLETDMGETTGSGMWDSDVEYQQQFGRRVLSPTRTNLTIDLALPKVTIEMAIPRTDEAGLTLQPGDTLGFQIDYTNVDRITRGQATTFDQWSYVYLPLSGDYATSSSEAADMPLHYELAQNYPNPFRQHTTIHYTLPAAENVTLAVYDLLGRRVALLVSGHHTAGRHEATWDGRSAEGKPVANGTYVYKLETSEGPTLTGTLVLIR